MNSKSELSLVLFLIALAVGSFFAVQDQSGLVVPDRLAAVFANQPAILRLEARTQTEGCQISGPLPDPECTPGAVFPEATLEKICVSGYSKTVRKVSTSLKRKVYAAYGVPYPQPRGSYEADHLIPLAIGGNNDIANLFPESGDPRPGFKEKDVVEVYLRDAVCAGQIELAAAQVQVANDWLSIYESLTPAERRRISEKYRNTWAGEPDFGDN